MKKIIMAALVIFLNAHLVSAQEEENKVDSLSDDIIQSIYKDVPDNVDSVAKKSSFNAYPYVFYTPESKLAFGAGLRYLFNKKEKINLRMDIGIGPEGSTGIYFGIEEVF